MRGLLTKLACDNYIHLVAASSIIRPGVAKSGMMKEYIHRYHFPHSFKYIAPVFEEQLSETFGIMVYQEDVMKIVHHFAGLGLDESDVLRRIMSGKKHDGDTFTRLKEKFFAGAQVRGHDLQKAEEVWRQIESFSGYSFCKAHSASFAVESFQSLYLKAYYPLEFMVGVINNFGGFYKTEFYVHEARLAGALIHAPCVNRGRYLTDLRGRDLYLGFIHVKGISEQLILRLLLERERGGVYQSLTDFCARLEVDGSQLDLLIRSGAFRFTEKTKAELLWEKNAVFNPRLRREPTPELFAAAAPQQYFHLDLSPNHRAGHPLSAEVLDQAFDELELLGFMLCSPFLLIREQESGVSGQDSGFSVQESGASNQELTINNQQSSTNSWGNRLKPTLISRVPDRGTITLRAYFVCDKVVPTVKGDRMSFGCWLDENGRHFDTVHFPDSLARHPFTGRGVYRLRGRVSREFGFPSLEVWEMKRLAYLGDLRFG
jgi:DNA polymerase-3 subunit alpha